MKPIIALTKALTVRFFRDKTAIFFTIFFPLIFLVIFGSLFGNDDNVPSFNVAIFNESSTQFAQDFIERGKDSGLLEVIEHDTLASAEEAIGLSELDAILTLPEAFGQTNEQGAPMGELVVQYSQGSAEAGSSFAAILRGILDQTNQQIAPYDPPFTVTETTLNTEDLRPFDYVFSGMLGFSILSLGIFGMAQGFASDKKTGAIARLQVAPIKAWHLVLATGLNRILLGLISIALLFVVSVVAFDFTMQGDWLSFIVLIILGTISMFGIGLIIGGWAKNENQAAPVANLIATPMMFLSGSFFPRFLMPQWLQDVTAYLPLTPINDGIRLVLTEGKTLSDLGVQLLIIVAWTVVSYIIAAKVFRWE